MMFRAPTDSRENSRRFYNLLYKQGFTTIMPDDASLATMTENKFRGTPKDFSRYVSVLHKVGLSSGDKLFDFGCSWGYGSWQFQQAGFDVWAHEVGEDRAQYAKEKLGVRMVGDVEKFSTTPEQEGTFDCFFSAHVLEHVPSPQEVFDLASRLLRPGGIFVSFTPNGSLPCRQAMQGWDQLWGGAHPNFIDDRFLLKAFPAEPIMLGSRDNLADLPDLNISESGNYHFDLTKYELVFATRVPSIASPLDTSLANQETL
jgi:SAM-dependent methyltransferase